MRRLFSATGPSLEPGASASEMSTRSTSIRSRRPAPTRSSCGATAGQLAAFKIGDARVALLKPLANALSFYENERDGTEYIPSPLRTAPGHLNDEDASVFADPGGQREGEFKGDSKSLGETINAAGGWWDAGTT